ncbi:MAG TPA: glycerophosphodiester phosphodiesterase [Candidatus Acidoferrum sp.]|nr:glycerophosphodiester phosphodiesterase [Candidatus Acidoferrum sp.]
MKTNTKTLLVPLLLSFALGAQTISSVEIIAHRGASFDAPENSLSAMKLAWEQAADAIELDLWLSKDGRLIVFHDADTKRFEQTARKIPSLTLAEAHKLDVGAWKDAKFKGESIPTLSSILATVPKGKRAVLEIKCGPEILPELSREIRNSGRAPEELAIISFKYETLKPSKEEFPQIEHYYLADYKKDAKTGKFPELDPLIERAKAAKFEGLNLQHSWPIDAAFVAKVKAAGLKLFVWTVDDPAIAKRLKDVGVDAITTNRPKFLRDELGR